ncbi:hypothetical protein CEQ21_00610 [Niallia circulans]|uniref:Uncharacterized protein n=1 Tax=Niallia circulans TaxID=1397 RepID=A0A553SRB8_NIACI|nr:hypothetical protein [Niallia circulans]TRZ39508.1 hypothetical protein CEQ21_00610 [Niallia circulans]
MKNIYTSFSFYCFLGTIGWTLLAYMVGSLFTPTGNTYFNGYEWLGYLFFAPLIITPILGVVFGFKGEKSKIKIISIFGNTILFFTISLLSIALIIYDFIPQ